MGQRKYWTFPLQLKYSVLISLVSGAVTLIQIFVFAWFVQRNYNLFLGEESGMSSHLMALLKKEQKTLEMALLALFTLSIAFSFGWSLYITHRLITPILALQKHIQNLLKTGKFRTFNLRKNDEFKELETLVNHLQHHLSQSAHYKESLG